MPTGDGSYTLAFAAGREHYHSLHGAVQESRHVFIANGLLAAPHTAIHLLEVGLGTGLNALMTWLACEERGIAVDYLALEPHPLAPATLEKLDHPNALGVPARWPGYRAMMTATPGMPVELPGNFAFRWLQEGVLQLEKEEVFDLVYFDAFAPDFAPGLWTEEVFHKVYRAMRPGATLVTYCVKGAVRRSLQAVGFTVERLPGPPGKRQMLRATR